MPDDKRERADRILDAAAELLVKWGYRRVTIDEVARRAGVGKGTVYLHWSSRDELFLAVLVREGTFLMDELIAAIRQDSAEIQLHRYLRRIFAGALRKPLLRGVYTRDSEMLGKLTDNTSGAALRDNKIMMSGEHISLLSEYGFLRDDIDPNELSYMIGSIILGHLVIDPVLPAEMNPSDERKADLLAETLRRTFEPETSPPTEILDELAQKVITIFEQMSRIYHDYAYHKGE